MIVKNEGEIIAKTLSHVLPLIDAYAIMDTGSTDNTISEIEKTLSGIPGRIETMEWAGFAESRNAAIDLAAGLGDYLVFVDADDMVVMNDSVEEIKKRLTASVHPVLIKHGPISYDRLIFRSLQSSSRYHFVVHEVLIPTQGDTIGDEISGIHIVHNAIGLSARNKQDTHKCRLDAQLIENELSRGVDSMMQSRYQFYLAQSYRDCGEVEKAFNAYQTRAEMQTGWEQEKYISALECGKLAGKRLGSTADQIMWFHKAIEIDHLRAEAYFEIAVLARQLKMWRLAFDNAVKARQRQLPARALFARREVYEWQSTFEVSIAAFYVDEMETGRQACEELLLNPNVPDYFKKLTLDNQRHYTK